MSTEQSNQEVVAVDRTLETAGKRPLPGSNIHEVIAHLFALVDKIPVSVINKHKPKNGPSLVDIFDELRWLAERWNVLEHGLMPIVQGLNTIETAKVLDERMEVLYWLFSDSKDKKTNQEIIELCKGSNNQRFTDTINFQIPYGYKGGRPTLLMGAALRAIDNYERSYGPYIPEPEFLIVNEEGENLRRFISAEWLEWWTNYSERQHDPVREAEDRVRASFADRNLKNLDVRAKKVTEPVFSNSPTAYEIFVTYEASL